MKHHDLALAWAIIASFGSQACDDGAELAADAAPSPDAGGAADAPRPADAGEPDAGLDLSCLGRPAPESAPDPLAVAGKVFAVERYRIEGLAGARVELRRRGDDALLGATETAADGGFGLEVESGGVPVDGVFLVTADGRIPTRIHPPTPLAGEDTPLLVAVSAEELIRWYADAGDLFEEGAPTLVAAAVDCGAGAAEGATVAIEPAPATLSYYDGSAWNPDIAASANGFALATRAPASALVTASAGGAELPPRSVAARPDELTFVVVSPRPY